MNDALLKDAMARFPSGVVVVTAKGLDGRPKGFTASSFTSVSSRPPLVLFCLATDAECYPHFKRAERYAVSVLAPEHRETALRFATRGADKFSTDIVIRPDGHRYVSNALVMMRCARHQRVTCGDHGIFVGQVEEVWLSDVQKAMIHYQRSFYEVCAAAPSVVRV